MGIFTNYKKKIEEEQQSWENDLQSYNREIASIKTMIEKACYLYNQEIATINSERSSLKELINKLYHFLKEFGEIGSKITPFDFVNESWQKIDVDAIVNSEMVPEASKKGNDDIYKYAAVGAFASTTVLTTVSTLLTPIPMAAPALLIPALFGGVSKKDYLAYQTKHLEALEEYDNNKEKLNDFRKGIELATNIAKLYYGVIATVKEAITETVIPELSGIRAFLYASSIANKVAEEKNLTIGIEPIDIMEIQGTRYNEHYVFMKNTVDYYTLLVEIFTKQVLTKMLEDNKITEDEKREFEMQIKQIENKQKTLCDNALFTKEG